jgi:hypothetical protein
LHKILLREKVHAAVDAAIRTGKVTKLSLVEQFLGQGASRASLYVWINKRIEEVAVDIATDTRTKPAHPPRKPKTKLEPEEIRPAALALAHRAAASPDEPGVEAIPFLARIQSNLARLDAVMAMAYKDETLKNPKLVLDTVEAIGRTLTRAARIQVVIEDRQRQEAFMEGVVKIITEEEPRVRDRIVGKLQNLRLSYGSISLAPRG